MNEGLYIHVPFCLSKCPYCNFHSRVYKKDDGEQYVKRIIGEFKKYSGTFDTIYFGGGTPSLLESEWIGQIIAGAKDHFTITDNPEITVECNPSKDMEKDFEKYASFGVNRISLGMQSAVDKERFALGRRAGAHDVLKTVHDAKKAGISNISLDLMLGTPKQTLDSLDESFRFIEKADVTHISAYMLKIEEKTKFFEIKDRLSLPDEDVVSQMYLKTIETLHQIGFSQYEISNFAKPGAKSRHNLKYWRLVPYLGIGESAHSYRDGKRFHYDNNFCIVNDGDGGGDLEKIMLALRLNEGVPKNLIKKDYAPYIKMGLMRNENNRLCLTPEGMLLSNTIIAELTE